MTACAASRSMPPSSGVVPCGRRSHSARSAARPSARAADSGYAKAATWRDPRSAAGTPSEDITTASTGLSAPASPAVRSTAWATSSAVPLTAGTKRTMTASIAGSASSSGSAAA